MKLMLLYYLLLAVLQQQTLSWNYSSDSEERTSEKSAVLSIHKDTITYLLATDNDLSREEKVTFRTRIEKSVESLRDHEARGKSGIKLIKKVRKEIFTNYLKEYKPLSTLSGGMRDGSYDCLTSALMHAYFFDKVGIDYQIFELTYHIYLLAEYKDGKKLLIEVTDPYYGLITGKKNIEVRIARYEEDNLAMEQENQDKYFLKTELDLNHQISFEELAALQFYNQAVKAFNGQDFSQAVFFANITQASYPCERNEELLRLSSEILQSMKRTALLHPKAEKVSAQ